MTTADTTTPAPERAAPRRVDVRAEIIVRGGALPRVVTWCREHPDDPRARNVRNLLAACVRRPWPSITTLLRAACAEVPV